MTEGASNPSPDPEYHGQDDIAIIGMAGRFPGANSVAEYWQNLLQGVESILAAMRIDLAMRWRGLPDAHADTRPDAS